jgi:hypothetical protein
VRLSSYIDIQCGYACLDDAIDDGRTIDRGPDVRGPGRCRPGRGRGGRQRSYRRVVAQRTPRTHQPRPALRLGVRQQLRHVDHGFVQVPEEPRHLTQPCPGRPWWTHWPGPSAGNTKHDLKHVRAPPPLGAPNRRRPPDQGVPNRHPGRFSPCLAGWRDARAAGRSGVHRSRISRATIAGTNPGRSGRADRRGYGPGGTCPGPSPGSGTPTAAAGSG